MSFLETKYPNLELMEYYCREYFKKSEALKKKVKEKKKNGWNVMEFNAFVFPQLWGSTCTAHDITRDGSPALAGSAMTKAYTVVMQETLTETFFVFVDNKPCYIVENPTEVFYDDLRKRNIKSKSMAMDAY